MERVGTRLSVRTPCERTTTPVEHVQKVPSTGNNMRRRSCGAYWQIMQPSTLVKPPDVQTRPSKTTKFVLCRLPTAKFHPTVSVAICHHKPPPARVYRNRFLNRSLRTEAYRRRAPAREFHCRRVSCSPTEIFYRPPNVRLG